MAGIRLYNKIAPRGLEILRDRGFSFSDAIGDPEGILVRSADLHGIELNPELDAIARAGAGVNNIPIERCTQQGIVVFNTPGANANGVKELVLAGLFMSSRPILQAVNWTRTLGDQGDQISAQVEKNKSRFQGPEIAGKTLGVIGLGAIGVMVANAADSLGMEVIGSDPFISVESAWGLSRSVRRADSLNQLLAQADYVTMHMPLTDKTRGVINRESLKMMKPGARLLNFARGGLVDDGAVLEALNSGHLSWYVTDFPSAALLAHEQVLPIPHLGASTPESEENCALMAAEQLADFLESGNIHNSVNFRDCVLPPSENSRITVTNRNVPNIIRQVTTILADSGFNILEMVNRSQGDFAYNIIDTGKTVTTEALTRIRNIEGVVRVRQPVPVGL